MDFARLGLGAAGAGAGAVGAGAGAAGDLERFFLGMLMISRPESVISRATKAAGSEKLSVVLQPTALGSDESTN